MTVPIFPLLVPIAAALPHDPPCTCFSTCSLAEARAFVSRLPREVSTSDSPWFAYLKAVYRSPVALPFDLSRLSFFYHRDDAWEREHAAVEWPMAVCRTVQNDARPAARPKETTRIFLILLIHVLRHLLGTQVLTPILTKPIRPSSGPYGRIP